MRKLSHNKRRTVGLVYEFLTREVTAATVARDPLRASEALDIIGRHLSEGSLLGPELDLHRRVMETRGVSERLARRIVDELRAAGIRRSAVRSQVDQAKTALIHEMNRRLGQDVWDRYRVPDYRVHASVGILMSRGIDNRIDEGVDLARVEEHLVEYLTSAPGAAIPYDPDASMYAYKTAVGLFEAEFGRELSGPQAELLREYVRVSLGGNPEPFERTFERQRVSLREGLRTRRFDETFQADKEMAGRLDEAIVVLEGMVPVADDDAVERLLLFHNLNDELESV